MGENNFPLCKCGCGREVTRIENKYIRGHGTRKPKVLVDRDEDLSFDIDKPEPVIEEIDLSERNLEKLRKKGIYQNPPCVKYICSCGFKSKIYKNFNSCPSCGR